MIKKKNDRYKIVAIVGTNTLLNMAERLYDRGEITEFQLQQMRERNNKLSNIEREDIIIKEVM